MRHPIIAGQSWNVYWHGRLSWPGVPHVTYESRVSVQTVVPGPEAGGSHP